MSKKKPVAQCVKCRKHKVSKGGLVWCKTCTDKLTKLSKQFNEQTNSDKVRRTARIVTKRLLALDDTTFAALVKKKI